MSHSNFSIEEHFPDMWDAIMHDWLADSSSANPDPDLPAISPKQRSLLRKVRPVGLMGLSLIHISEPTRRHHVSRMPSSA